MERMQRILDYKPDFARDSATLLVNSFEFVRGTRLSVPENMPTEGPVLVVSNHPGRESTILLPWAVRKATGRIPSIVMKRTLTDSTHQESSRILEETGKTGDIFSREDSTDQKNTVIFSEKAKRLASRAVTSYISHAVDAIPIDRDGLKLSTMKTVNTKLQEEGKIVGVFLQWTRTPADSLENAMPAAASIIKMNPDVPVVMMAQNPFGMKESIRKDARPHVVLDEPFRLVDPQIDPERSMSKDDIHAMLVQRMVPLLQRAGVTTR